MSILGFAFLLFCLPDFTFGQGTEIQLTNGSFEDRARPGVLHGRPHRGWFDCGPATESVPDVQPSADEDNWFFGVSTPALKGNTYIGLVVRDNDTWESVAQRMKDTKLEKGKLYHFQVALARSPVYLSPSRDREGKMTDHTTPCVLRIFGADGYCGKKQLLVHSDLIDHTNWRIYTFRFRPEENYEFFTLEAFYERGTLKPYNGNLLVDDLRLFELPEGEELTLPDVIVPPQKERIPIDRRRYEQGFTYNSSVQLEPIQESTPSEEEVVVEKEPVFDPRKDIQNVEQLKTYVSHRGQQCSFTYKKELLAFLEILSEKMTEFPAEDIVIGISEEEFERKGTFIREAFDYYKLSQDRFQIVRLSGEDQSDWLSVNPDFAWRLVNGK